MRRLVRDMLPEFFRREHGFIAPYHNSGGLCPLIDRIKDTAESLEGAIDNGDRIAITSYLADLLELNRAVARASGIPFGEVIRRTHSSFQELGGFHDRVMMDGNEPGYLETP